MNDSATAAKPSASADPADIGKILAEIVEEASALIMPFWRAQVAVDHKADESPVTEADHAAEALILKRLAAEFPRTPVIAEEEVARDGVPAKAAKLFFLVDPLDGTKGFLRGTEAFTVNIALIENGKPVAGAVAAPASGLVWFTAEGGAFKRKFGETTARPIKARQKPQGGGLALLSHTVAEDEASRIAAKYGCKDWRGMDSSVKFCLIAEGSADVYPRPGRTMEWDTAAGQAVLEAAGGRVISEAGETLGYGKSERGFDNPGFLAIGG